MNTEKENKILIPLFIIFVLLVIIVCYINYAEYTMTCNKNRYGTCMNWEEQECRNICAPRTYLYLHGYKGAGDCTCGELK
jgi:uncharacterized alpha/beta hydrolase family protein